MDNIFGLGSTEPDRTGQLTGHDRAGLVEPHFALDLYQVAALFDDAGLARNRRSLSRYCMAGKLDCQKVETLNGEEWRIDEQVDPFARSEGHSFIMRPTPRAGGARDGARPAGRIRSGAVTGNVARCRHRLDQRTSGSARPHPRDTILDRE